MVVVGNAVLAFYQSGGGDRWMGSPCIGTQASLYGVLNPECILLLHLLSSQDHVATLDWKKRVRAKSGHQRSMVDSQLYYIRGIHSVAGTWAGGRGKVGRHYHFIFNAVIISLPRRLNLLLDAQLFSNVRRLSRMGLPLRPPGH